MAASTRFDTYLEAIDAKTGNIIDANDDCGGTVNSCLTLPVNDRRPILLRVSPYHEQAGGAYVVRLD
jgi:hypothetical protein